jgi:FMN-dependent oxidoreductase (nitrilotriacetate monooxygenase family)
VRDDRGSGRYADPQRIRRIDHDGTFYRVKGPLNFPRPPQGWPVLVQAGSSDTGRSFAGRYAEAVFTAHLQKETAQAFYADLKSRAAAFGRAAHEVVVLPGISPVIGSTEAEAARTWEELNELSDPAVGLERLSNRFGGHDFSHLRLDAVLSVDDFPDPAGVQAAQSRAQVITDLVARERPTLRQLLQSLAGARGHLTVAGTPDRIADLIEDWFTTGAADGFNVMPPILPTQFEVFIEHVLPILRRRGLFRTEYRATTLRGHLGLKRPANRYFPQAVQIKEAV